MSEPKFSVSQITTLHSSLAEDLETYTRAGANGIGIWEFKLGEGSDAEPLARFRDSGLEATTCVPDVLSIWPIPMPGPTEPQERVRALCAAIERLAPFEPEAVLCLTGHPGHGVAPAEARRVVVEGVREAARVAAAHGLVLGLEPLHRAIYADWSLVGDIPGAISLLDEIGEENVKLLYDVYNLWDTPTVLADTLEHAERIIGAVHVCDARAETRNGFDRVLPGDGVIDLAALLGALDSTGIVTWLDLEIFSDDGTFSDQAFDDSLWKQPAAEVIARGRAGIERAWEARGSAG